MCHCVWSRNPKNEAAPPRVGLLHQGRRRRRRATLKLQSCPWNSVIGKQQSVSLLKSSPPFSELNISVPFSRKLATEPYPYQILKECVGKWEPIGVCSRCGLRRMCLHVYCQFTFIIIICVNRLGNMQTSALGDYKRDPKYFYCSKLVFKHR